MGCKFPIFLCRKENIVQLIHLLIMKWIVEKILNLIIKITRPLHDFDPKNMRMQYGADFYNWRKVQIDFGWFVQIL